MYCLIKVVILCWKFVRVFGLVFCLFGGVEVKIVKVERLFISVSE